MNRFNRVILLVAVLLIAVTQSALVQAQADGPESSFDQKYLNPEYIVYSGIEGVAEQARTVHAVSSFDCKFMTMGSIVRSLDAEMDMAQEVRWTTLAEFYADSLVDSYDVKLFDDGYIANSGMAAIVEQARAVRNAAAFDSTFTMVGSIVHNLEAEMDMAQEVRWTALAEFYADSLVDSYDVKLVDHGYVANSGTAAIVEQARAVRNAAAFDINFITAGSIMRSLQAEMEVADALRWEEMAEFYADSGLLTIDPDASIVYRWKSLVGYYVTNGLLNDGREIAVQENANR